MTRKTILRGTLLLAFIVLASGSIISVVSYRNTIKPEGVVIHHSATFRNRILRPSDIEAISANHRQKGFSSFYWGKIYDIGYHYVILPDGTIVQGRPEILIGAHTRGFNSYLGICLIGDFSEGNFPIIGSSNRPTPEQIASLVLLTQDLTKKYGIPDERIHTHQDLNKDTECPGENFPNDDFFQRFHNANRITVGAPE